MKTLKKFPSTRNKTVAKFNWDPKLFDGRVIQLDPKVDYEGEQCKFVLNIRCQAVRFGRGVSVVQNDDGSIVMQGREKRAYNR